jgi:hypothetical protein
MAYTSVGARPTIQLGPIYQDQTKPPDPVSATSPYQFASVLGRQIPIVIGTGKVDGNPVIGGSTTSRVITGYQQYPHTAAGAKAAGGSGFDSALDSFPPGSKWTTGDAFSPTVDVPVYGTSVGASLGYLLAYDPFNLGYLLVRLEVNDEVVYDAENGIGASTTFRFYGGQHTAIDPIAKAAIGANAGAWQNFAMVYLDGFAADSPPTVKAVISNASTTTPPSGKIVWTGPAPSGVMDAFPHGSAYDPAEDVIYQILQPTDIPGLTQIYLAVLDAATRTERYRVPLEGSEPYAVGTDVIDYQLSTLIAIPGTGLVLAQLQGAPAAPRLSAIYDSATGHILASQIDTVNQNWLTVQSAPDNRWLFIGHNFDAGTGVTGIYDAVAGTFTVDPEGVPGRYLTVTGRRTTGFSSFFTVDADIGGAASVYELRFDGSSWSSTLLQSLTGDFPTVKVLWFDPQTGYLVILQDPSAGSRQFKYIDPDTGTVVDSFTISDSDPAYFNSSFLLPVLHNRLISRPGFVLMLADTGSSTYGIYLLDIVGKSVSIFASGLSAPDATRMSYVIADQAKGQYITAIGDYFWTVHQQQNVAPGAISLQSLITKTMLLAGYSSGELTFSGFDGLTAYGFVIDQDTNVRTVLQSIADIYTFSFADTGNGFYFKKPGRDDSFLLDDTLTTADLVFVESDGSVKSEDDATIRSVARVELQYISKDQGYNSRPASFSMPAINNSIRTERYSTPLVMTDLDAQTFVTEKFFDLQAKRRNHAFSVTGKPTYLPGDVISVPSGEASFTVQIDSVGMDRNLTAEIAALDFQTKVSTTVTSVTGPVVSAVSQATQYIHLDLPLISYGDDLAGLGLCQYGILAGRGQANWSGGLLLTGYTADALTQAFTQAPHQGVVGTCITQMNGPVDPFATDDASTVTIRRTAGSVALLVDKTEAEVLAGANLAFIGRAGRWEGVGYKTVTDNGDNTYTLSGFTVRGYHGSEVYAYSHEVGDIFVMIDPAWLHVMGLPLTDLGLTKYFEAVGVGQSPTSGAIIPGVIRGIAETPYACVNLAAEVVTDGIEISFDYRSRLAAGLNPANFGEETLSFEIDILEPTTDGLSVVRTLTSTTNSKLYADADVVADFGADPPDELFFDVYMMSAVVGRGHRARHHVYFTAGGGTPVGLLLSLTRT